MTNNNFVGTRLSPKLKQCFDKHVEKSGKKPADVIREAISSYLNFMPSTITIDINVITDLQNRVKALEEKLEQPIQVGLEVNNIESNTENLNTEWMTTKKAYETYVHEIKYSTFRRMSVAELLKRYGLEGDLKRKNRGRNYPWLRRVQL